MLGPDQFPDASDFQIQRLVLRLEKVIPSDPTLLDDAVREITAALDCTACWGDVGIDFETIALVSHEALANAIVHGNHCVPEQTVTPSPPLNQSATLPFIVTTS